MITSAWLSYGRLFLFVDRQVVWCCMVLCISVHIDEVVATASPGEEAARHKRFEDVIIRTYFPETWLWLLSQVGLARHLVPTSKATFPQFLLLWFPLSLLLSFRDTGSTSVLLKVPDTIITWETEAFCMSSKGFGLAPPVKLTVFQPFFLEFSLPYSIIRGETFELKATVFNYLSKCIMVWIPFYSYKGPLWKKSCLYSMCTASLTGSSESSSVLCLYSSTF